jgi:hypothetical protein
MFKVGFGLPDRLIGAWRGLMEQRDLQLPTRLKNRDLTEPHRDTRMLLTPRIEDERDRRHGY